MPTLDNRIKQNINKFKYLGFYHNDIQIMNELYLVTSKLKYKKEFSLDQILTDAYNNDGNIVGYTIKNVSNKIIKNIIIPEYQLVNDKYKGKITYIDLLPGQTLTIPTKWLILLLSRIEYAYKCRNGNFIKPSNMDNDSIDTTFKYYRFDKNLYKINIGISYIKSSVNDILSEYSKYFGYLFNKKSYKEIKIKTNTAKFVASLFIKR